MISLARDVLHGECAGPRLVTCVFVPVSRRLYSPVLQGSRHCNRSGRGTHHRGRTLHRSAGVGRCCGSCLGW